MDSHVEVRLLGPLDVRVDGAALPLGAPKQQVALARLVVSAGQVVSLDELIDEIWPVRPPASAVENARTYAANSEVGLAREHKFNYGEMARLRHLAKVAGAERRQARRRAQQGPTRR